MRHVMWKECDFNIRDCEAISTLRKKFNKEQMGNRRSVEAEYYIWKYANNKEAEPVVCLAKDKGKIVGLLAVVPKRIMYGRDILLAGELCDAFTDQDYQRQGIFRSLLKSTLEKSRGKGLEIIYGTPNKNALPAEIKAGYKIISSIKVKNMIMPLNIRNIVGVKIKNRLIGDVTAKMIKMAYSIIKKKEKNRKDSKLLIKIEKVIDEDIQILFKEESKKWHLMFVRDKEYIEWRFNQNPDEYKIIALYDDDIIKGYMVLKLGRWGNIKVGYIADYLVSDNSKYYEKLLNISIREFKKDSVDLVSCWTTKGWPFYRKLLRYGFIPAKNVPVILHEESKIAQEILWKKKKWYFTMADSDNI